MILPAGICHEEQIVALWNYAFGDSVKDIEKYLETILKYVIVYEEDNIVKGMLSVLPVSFCDKNGGYIYAVTTHKDYRGQGICNKLMEYVKGDKKYDFLVLKPQNDGLFEFYKKMGFDRVMQLSKKEVFASGDETKYQLKKISASGYETARDAYFGEDSLIKWDSRMLSFAKNMYCGEFYAVEKDEKGVGVAFLYKDKNVVAIKELLTEEPEDVAGFIAFKLECQKAEYLIKNPQGEVGFMVYPKDKKTGYFNIYLD